MAQKFEYDVFLSHSSKDKRPVRELAERLKRDGLRIWLDEWAIKPGDSIPLAIEHGLEHSRILVLVMSRHAFASDWVTLERHTVLFRDPANRQRRLIPLRLDDAPIRDMLRLFAYIDWRDKSDREYEKLVAACQSTDIADIHAQRRDITWLDRLTYRNLNAFVGRRCLCRDILDHCLSHDSRLVTLHGPGGIGKTRIAFEIAFRLRDEFMDAYFPDGIAIVTFDNTGFGYPSPSAEAEGLVAAQVLRTLEPLGAPRASSSARDVLMEWLCGRRMLLLLDGFENVYHARGLLQQLLLCCEDVQLLVTSRVELQIDTVEDVFTVKPMGIPEEHRRAPVSRRVEALRETEAYNLFESRVRLVHSRKDWCVTEETVDAVTDILLLTSGIPLAIELAATHSSDTSFEAIAVELNRNVVGARQSAQRKTALPLRQSRHRSLQGCFDYSFQRLDSQCQSVFPQLGIFPGTFTLDAVQGVCDVKDPEPVLRILHSSALLDSEIMCDDTPRFVLLHVLRDFALELLGEKRGVVSARHRLFFGEYCRKHTAALFQMVSRDRSADTAAKALDVEHANIFAALRDALRSEDTRDVCMFSGILDVLRHRGYLSEVGALWEECVGYLKRVGVADTTQKNHYWFLVNSLGRIKLDQGDIDGSIHLLEQNLRFEGRSDEDCC